MPDSNRPSPKSRQLTIPTRLYSRGHFYYLRVVSPDRVEPQPGRGRLEIRLSLRTAYRQTAKKLAHWSIFISELGPLSVKKWSHSESGSGLPVSAGLLRKMRSVQR